MGLMNQKQDRHRALTITRIIYEEMQGHAFPFDEARKLKLTAYEAARRAADRIIEQAQKR